MPKIKILLWQLCHKAFPVRGTLLRRGINLTPVCPLCMDDLESIDNLFKDCEFVHRLWDLAAQHG